MCTDQRSRQIAGALSSLWDEAKQPRFAEYVQRVYGVEVNALPRFCCLYIGETQDGALERGPTPGLLKQWWKVDDHGLCEVRSPKLDWESDSDFVLTPFVLFFRDGDYVAISEHLGQRLVCWKLGRLHITGDQVTISDLRLLDL